MGEYGDNDLDGLVPPSSALDIDSAETYTPPTAGPGRLLFYAATLQAFVIVYRTEVLLGGVLAVSLGVAFGSAYGHRHRKVNPFKAAHVHTDYSAITSKYDLTLGKIDHWCIRGDDNNCRCEDPLVPMSKRSSHKWEEQHKENIKVAQATLMKVLKTEGGSYEDYFFPDYDDMWLEGMDDDWVWGEGSRFYEDDLAFDPFAEDYLNEEGVMEDDGYADVRESPTGNGDEGRRQQRRRALDGTVEGDYELDVVFIGDSITEQRQGTRMGRPEEGYTGIKEVFDKTFTKEKGGDYNGIALGISGDTSPQVLWRLMNGEMPDGLDPKVWWIGIGINDLTIKGCSEEIVLLGILRVVEEIQNRHPDDVVVINSILPIQRNEEGLLEHVGKHHEDIALKKKEKDMADNEMSSKRLHIDLWPSIVAINEELSKFASKHHGVKFFDADSVFIEERTDEKGVMGKYLKMDLMRDPVHPNLQGHKRWNNAIKKKLASILSN
ncbi:hypothetical protein THAOC_34265 [Thalassiosira oceanica]|uniref:SGNH hydrolase-type esterase domain-containing protein n=1 Tax=Thalassiosira oceanica TaxID=159749 RepID=K0RD68_THAOC|nr:hypothetical protein THAOC_34265 [Thalassiosira oceanica]|eukprot:EJK47041.1 hypothetical protein THAOC_34265 [Thalassiosira oceanica]